MSGFEIFCYSLILVAPVDVCLYMATPRQLRMSFRPLLRYSPLSGFWLYALSKMNRTSTGDK